VSFLRLECNKRGENDANEIFQTPIQSAQYPSCYSTQSYLYDPRASNVRRRCFCMNLKDISPGEVICDAIRNPSKRYRPVIPLFFQDLKQFREQRSSSTIYFLRTFYNILTRDFDYVERRYFSHIQPFSIKKKPVARSLNKPLPQGRPYHD